MNISESKHYEFLQSVSIFKNLNKEELNIIIKYLSTKEISENKLVFARLEKEQVLYIVRYGKLKLELPGLDDTIFDKSDVFGEIAIINKNFRTGTIRAIEPAMLFCLNGIDLLNNEKIPARIALKIFVELAKKVTSYLSTAENTSTYRLIEQGENDNVEFKSTLRFNLFTKKYDKEIEHAALKSIVAFMNSSGGTLIIGVDDNKNVLGLKDDNFQDDDRMLLHLTKLIQNRIGMQYTRFVRATIEETNGDKILRTDVTPSSKPAFLEHGNEEIFYIRTGPATSQMRVSEIYDYIQSRFYLSKP
ncbi:MAG: putative DNA binding domain-containing protein [Bacteroidales bacterium]|nr:putative DNA binding domain-containing protein [Bacteroidales bacterium]